MNVEKQKLMRRLNFVLEKRKKRRNCVRRRVRRRNCIIRRKGSRRKRRRRKIRKKNCKGMIKKR